MGYFVLLISQHRTCVDTLSVVANKGFKEKEIMCNFVNTNEVVNLLKKHVESINIFYNRTIYFYTGWTIKVFSSIGA